MAANPSGASRSESADWERWRGQTVQLLKSISDKLDVYNQELKDHTKDDTLAFASVLAKLERQDEKVEASEKQLVAYGVYASVSLAVFGWAVPVVLWYFMGGPAGGGQ